MSHSRPGLPVHHQILESTQTPVHRVDNAIQPSYPLSSPSPPALNLSQHQLTHSNESALRIRWPKYWSFSFNISPSNEYSGLISYRMDWLDLLAVQGTLKSLLQHHTSKASILRHSAFFIVQLSHPYMTTGKAIALSRQTIVGKVMSLLFHMLSRWVMAFLPRSKRLLISRLQSPLSSTHKAEGNTWKQQLAVLENKCDGGEKAASEKRWGQRLREERDQKDLTLRVWVADTAGIRRDQPHRSSSVVSMGHKLGVRLHARLGPWVGKWNERNSCLRQK